MMLSMGDKQMRSQGAGFELDSWAIDFQKVGPTHHFQKAGLPPAHGSNCVMLQTFGWLVIFNLDFELFGEYYDTFAWMK